MYSTHLILLLPSLASATCYWQNSTLAPSDPFSIATDDTACFPDQDNSPCCGTGWTCLSDGVCYIKQDTSDFYYRGTCTDRTWNSQQCPGWCFAQNANSSIPLIKCPGAQDWYCCPGDASCDCTSGKFAVKLGDSQPSTVTVIGSTTWPGMQSTTAGFTQQPLNTAGTKTGSESQSTSGGATATLGAAASASASETGGPNVSASNKDGGSNVGLAAGLGAGLGAAAVIIAGLAFYVVRSRRRKHAAALLTDKGYDGNGSTNVGLYQDSQVYSSSQSEMGPGAMSGHGHQQYYDANKPTATQTPNELSGSTLEGRERAELSDSSGMHKQNQKIVERAELGG